MTFREYLQQSIVIMDGGMGTLLQARGLRPGEHPEIWNLTHAEEVVACHKAYFDAGSNTVSTNTFGANRLKFTHKELERIIAAAVANVKAARTASGGQQEKFVALDIGPSGKLLKPYGDMDFEEAVELFAEQVRIGAACGVDLVLIETMNDSLETKAALLAVKENCDLPVLVSNAYGEDGKLMTGASPEVMCAMLEGMGADAIGVNCSLGPKALAPVVRRYLACAGVPVLLKPNAGLPEVVDGKTVYNVLPEEFAADVAGLLREGVRVAGGCCGTTPDYIAALRQAAAGFIPAAVTAKQDTVAASYTHTVRFGGSLVRIGERINPTGKKLLQKALREGDVTTVLKMAAQEEPGSEILDVNAGLPDIDEVSVLKQLTQELQAVTDLPLQLDSMKPEALEAALRVYNGKAMINSVNGREDSMRAIFPLVKKYGGLVVALTLDEKGIPEDAQGRLDIARRILDRAAEYGIDKKDVVFDPLALTVSSSPTAALVTLETVKRIHTELGCHTSLGVSNISFGLPDRGSLNAGFLTLAMQAGLSAAIMNPLDESMQQACRVYDALCGRDPDFLRYIPAAQAREAAGQLISQGIAGGSAAASGGNTPAETAQVLAPENALPAAIKAGRRAEAGELCRELLKTKDPLDIISELVIPALNEVGKLYETKKLYLPQLLMSAETAGNAFEAIKAAMSGQKLESNVKCPFVLATVEGDIHDIGKNIVHLLMENYGFSVIDLGKDVPPEKVLEAVLEKKAPIAGLSALMTTTVPAMERTIKLLHEKAPACRVIVGGAVLTPEYAEKIGADAYAADAMETVRISEDLWNKKRNLQ